VKPSLTASDYRPVSSLAMVTSVTAALSVLALAWPECYLLCWIGMALSAVSIERCHRYQFGGRRVALASGAGLVVLAVAVPIWHRHLHVLENPLGARRIRFEELARDDQFSTIESGSTVLLKGFPVPEGTAFGETFVLTPSGDLISEQEKLRSVLVESVISKTPVWGVGALAVSGRLVRRQSVFGPRWVIKDAIVRPITSRWDPAPPRSRRSC
jgi:hypothetical protein